MSTLRRPLFASLLFIGLILVLACAWLINTTSGLRWLVQQAGDIVTVDSIEGDVSEFRFRGLRIEVAETLVDISSGSARLDLLSVVRRQLSVEQLEADSVTVTLPKAGDSDEPYQPWSGLSLPIDVSLRRAQITQLSVYQQQDILLELDKIVMRGTIADSYLQLQELTLADGANQFSLDGAADLSAQAQGKVDLSYALRWQLGEQNIDSQGGVNGVWRELKLDLESTQPYAVKLSGQIDNALSQEIAWQLEALTKPIEEVQVSGQSVSLQQGNLRSRGQFRPAQGVTGLEASLSAQLAGGSDALSTWQIESDVELADDILTVNKLELQQSDALASSSEPTTSAGHLSVLGSVRTLSAFLQQSNRDSRIDLKGVWQDLSWPLSDPSPEVRASGDFSVQGSSADYSIVAKGQGESFGQAIELDVDVNVTGANANIKRLRLVSKDALLLAKGTINERYNLNWELRVADIGNFLSQASGAISSVGTLGGARAQPQLSLQANTTDFDYLGYAVDQARINAKVSNSTAKNAIDVQFVSGKIVNEQRLLAQSIDFRANGALNDHELVLRAQLAGKRQLRTQLNGRLLGSPLLGSETNNGSEANREWRGELTTLTLDDPVLATWELQRPVEIAVAKDLLDVSQACLRNLGQSLCLELASSLQSMQLNASVQALDLANLNVVTSLYGVEVTGQADGDLDYSKLAEQDSGTLQGQFESSSTVLKWQDQLNGEAFNEEMNIDLISLNLAQDQVFSAKALVDLPEQDVVEVELKVQAAIEASDFMQAQAEASGRMLIDDLSVLPATLTQAANVNGSLQADMNLSGSLAQPVIVANARLQNASAEVPELGLNLVDIKFDVTSSGGSKLGVDGSLKSGEGELSLQGSVDFLDLATPEVQLDLSGNNLQLANTSDLDIVGDLDFDLILTQKLLDISGQVSLDKALLGYALPASAVLASDDVILEGEQQQVTQTQQKLRINVDLGSQTRVRAKGLDAQLAGNILVFQEPGGILRADGEIRVNRGRYRAYGQDLEIDQGSLIFSGGSIDDPNLNLSTQKVVDSVTAGVSVTGRASNPVLELYSSPSMPDEDILSVLIFGKQVGALGSQDGLTLLRIANSLRGDGTSNLTKITEGLQQTLGLSSLELQLNADSPTIQAGKQLSSKFYVGYGYGLLNAAQSLILRYVLTDQWSIKADVGADSGADLRYELER